MIDEAAVLKACADGGVKLVRLQFSDILGNVKNVAIPVEQLESALAGRVMFDGSSIEGFVRIEESDMFLHPDLSTFCLFPWKSRAEGAEARLICDVYNPDGTPFAGCPRGTLRRVMDKAAALGFTMYAGPEAEFFLFERDANGEPTTTPHDQGSYFDLMPVDMGEEARRDMVVALEGMGFEIERSQHEAAPGQHEIDFRYADALKAADMVSTFRIVVRTIAMKHGLHATFMPKPVQGINGSGMHTNISLFRGDKNAFFDPDAEEGLSQEARWFLGGLIRHAKGITAITNPIVNSYKRLVPGYEAPVYIAWSAANRSPLIRVPAPRGLGTRLELRSPDPSCNPYLAMAVIFAAGLDGIANRINPPAAVNRNIFHMTVEERLAEGVDSLPGSLEAALIELERDRVVCDALGEHVLAHFMTAKQIEWDIYRSQVHKWETEQYLNVF